jgi:hypothetical protein
MAWVPAQPPAPCPSMAPRGTPTLATVARAHAFVQRAAAAREAKALPRALPLLAQAIPLDPTAKAVYNSLGTVYDHQWRSPFAPFPWPHASAGGDASSTAFAAPQHSTATAGAGQAPQHREGSAAGGPWGEGLGTGHCGRLRGNRQYTGSCSNTSAKRSVSHP